MTHEKHLRSKAETIKRNALNEYQSAIAQASELETMASLLELHRDDLKESKVTEIEAIAATVESEWLQDKLDERIAMRERGEDIAVPESIEALKAELERQEQAER